MAWVAAAYLATPHFAVKLTRPLCGERSPLRIEKRLTRTTDPHTGAEIGRRILGQANRQDSRGHELRKPLLRRNR